MSDVSRSYDGPDDRDTDAMVREFMAANRAALARAGLCGDHALPLETCPYCAVAVPQDSPT